MLPGQYTWDNTGCLNCLDPLNVHEATLLGFVGMILSGTPGVTVGSILMWRVGIAQLANVSSVTSSPEQRARPAAPLLLASVARH